MERKNNIGKKARMQSITIGIMLVISLISLGFFTSPLPYGEKPLLKVSLRTANDFIASSEIAPSSERIGSGERSNIESNSIASVTGRAVGGMGRGFGITTIKNIRQFYLTYKDEISQSVTGEFGLGLTWTHYCELMKIEDITKRRYFERYAIQEKSLDA